MCSFAVPECVSLTKRQAHSDETEWCIDTKTNPISNPVEFFLPQSNFRPIRSQHITNVRKPKSVGALPREQSILQVGPGYAGTEELPLPISTESVCTSETEQVTQLHRTAAKIPCTEAYDDHLPFERRKGIFEIEGKLLRRTPAIDELLIRGSGLL